MSPVGSRRRTFIAALVVLALATAGRIRMGSTRASPEEIPPSVTAAPSADAPRPTASRPGAQTRLQFPVALEAGHRLQIEHVIDSMDQGGTPPAGIAQGGRRGGPKSEFHNAEGRLRRERRGYWIESDVWPKNGPRDAERLVFGRGHEVYLTLDHYQTFVRLR